MSNKDNLSNVRFSIFDMFGKSLSNVTRIGVRSDFAMFGVRAML